MLTGGHPGQLSITYTTPVKVDIWYPKLCVIVNSATQPAIEAVFIFTMFGSEFNVVFLRCLSTFTLSQLQENEPVPLVINHCVQLFLHHFV
mmetsp:Transcript_55980/g.117114  ORF Transcript_55980/g.117114 Transcript_55980/m.117114 type:complete len:91 (-) Transcript_55980:929-1201(-)